MPSLEDISTFQTLGDVGILFGGLDDDHVLDLPRLMSISAYGFPQAIEVTERQFRERSTTLKDVNLTYDIDNGNEEDDDFDDYTNLGMLTESEKGFCSRNTPAHGSIDEDDIDLYHDGP
ncbi:hypothetical protein BGX27_007810 [Mortierella sp. AM989]|nr:hypothetical protein BGX27_007810 [Mortierella sp. AM989]